MFPGFVTIYKDNNGFINLYFYPGLNDDNEFIYKPLELINYNDYNKIVNNDNSIIYKFNSNKIKSINCKLISNNDISIIKLSI